MEDARPTQDPRGHGATVITTNPGWSGFVGRVCTADHLRKHPVLHTGGAEGSAIYGCAARSETEAMRIAVVAARIVRRRHTDPLFALRAAADLVRTS